MNKSLISMSDDFISSMRMLEELSHDTEMTPEEREKFSMEIVTSLVGDEKSMVTKVQNISRFMDAVGDNVRRAREWKDDINTQIKSAENMVERIKAYALSVLHHVEAATGVKYVESNGIRISYQSQGDKAPLVVTDESLIPSKFFEDVQPPPVRTLNKKALQAALASGEKVDGAYIAPQAEGIRIKNVLPKG